VNISLDDELLDIFRNGGSTMAHRGTVPAARVNG
jgi:hypothetical protein